MKLIHWLEAIWFISIAIAWWQIFMVKRQLRVLRRQSIHLQDLTAMFHQLIERDKEREGESERR